VTIARPRHALRWGSLVAVEPTRAELRDHAPALARAYSDERNASLLGHTEPLVPADVIAHYARLGPAGHAFLLFDGDDLAGDGDLRGLTADAAEFAFLIADPDAQGKGLGTRFALLVHTFAFRTLGLARIYASVVPANVASRRVFAKLGYAADDSPTARAFADEPGDLVLAIDRATFLARNADAVAQIEIAVR
jgi:RimJ/RimL family protein N-acetyltransferase